jgi:hypothetical protein
VVNEVPWLNQCFPDDDFPQGAERLGCAKPSYQVHTVFTQFSRTPSQVVGMFDQVLRMVAQKLRSSLHAPCRLAAGAVNGMAKILSSAGRQEQTDCRADAEANEQ